MCNLRTHSSWRFAARPIATTTMRSSLGSSQATEGSPMCSPKRATLAFALLALHATVFAQTYNLGRPITEAQVAPWTIDVFPSGEGLPAGKGSVAEGKNVYESKCAACHGLKGEGTLAD